VLYRKRVPGASEIFVLLPEAPHSCPGARAQGHAPLTEAPLRWRTGAREGDVANDPSYIGYFENRHGEQWIFTFDRATREARLRGGDAGWATAHPVCDGRVDGLILAPEEIAWLQVCWSATRA